MANQYSAEKSIGQKIGNATVIKHTGKDINNNNRFIFKCDCGHEFETTKVNFSRKKDQSCGRAECQFAKPKGRPKIKESTKSNSKIKEAKVAVKEIKQILVNISLDSEIKKESNSNSSLEKVIPDMEFGLLTVLNVDNDNQTAHCVCRCGREVNISQESLLSKKRVSCLNEFCKHNPKGFNKYAKQIDLIAYYQM